MATPILTTSDVAPRELATLFRSMADALDDHEVTSILHDAQHRLEALAWNRWGQRTSAASMRSRFIARHKGLQEGLRHA